MGKEHYNKKSDGGREVMGREEGGAGRGEERRGEERRGEERDNRNRTGGGWGGCTSNVGYQGQVWRFVEERGTLSPRNQ